MKNQLVLVGPMILAAVAMFLGPAMFEKARLRLQGIRSRIVLPHLTHLDSESKPSRWQRRAMSTRLGRSVWMLQDESGAVTLAQAKLNAQDDIDFTVINEFQKSSYFMDNLIFDDVVNPAGRGGTFTYGYTRQITQANAAFRAVNSEYTPGEVTKARYTVDLKIFGGSFQIDRALRGIGALDEVDWQLQNKIQAAVSLFHDTAINGDSGVDANSFDGLDKMLTGTSTEFRPTTVTDWTGAVDEAEANNRIDDFNAFLRLLDGGPTVIFANSLAAAKIDSMGRRAGYVNYAPDAFGNLLARYRGVPIVDLGAKPGSNDEIIPVESRTVDAVGYTGLTDIYAVRLGLDAFHGVSLSGRPLIETFLPDFSTPGAVKSGEVEGIMAVVLKRSKGAAVWRNVKVT